MIRAPWWRVAPAVFLLAWGGNHFTPLLHLYEELGRYAAWQANLLLGMYVLGLVPGLLIAAALSDRFGRKPVLLTGVILGIGASVMLGLGLHSFVLLCAGRALAGVGVGIAMSVGSSWIKELSAPEIDPSAARGSGARRPTLTLTIGFGLGAAVTGILAQWAPDPSQLPYAVHALLSILALVPLLRARETLTARPEAGTHWWQDLRIPASGGPAFRRVIVPAAPWVFAAAGIAYAIMPAIAARQMGEWTTLYATILTVLTLGTGALVQPYVAKLDGRTRGQALSIGLALMSLGIVLAVVAAILSSPILPFIVAPVLGCAYGITVVAGLTRVQAIATPQDLAGLTGIYYSLTYSGFLLPAVLAALLPVLSYTSSLAIVAVICIICLVIVYTGSKRFRPGITG
ncbi:MFS transporter [Mycetocola saprophilus]|uniref:MFS transporter n=1 Tax=Mycetocola saprophilus TaxID=76636 RepID=UPI000692597B|nr:MFS transporter [Mycetocola saprophilus]